MDFGDSVSIVASFYGKGDGFAGKRTASGERLNPRAFTVAHKTPRFGTRVLLSRDGKMPVVARVTDRGPFIRGRDLDVTPAVAEALGFLRQGVGKLQMRVLRADEAQELTSHLARSQ
jgi:rare lipoprotein A